MGNRCGREGRKIECSCSAVIETLVRRAPDGKKGEKVTSKRKKKKKTRGFMLLNTCALVRHPKYSGKIEEGGKKRSTHGKGGT